MVTVDSLHSALYGLNFVAGLVFTVAFAVETFQVFDGVCPLYLRLDKVDWGVREDHLPVCNLMLTFHAIFQCAWPLLLAWLYAVSAGICYRVCNNACCCPTTAAATAGGPEELQDSSSDSLTRGGDSTRLVGSGVCQHCCLRVMLLDFRASRRLSFRAGERRLFCAIAGLQFGVTGFFGIFLASTIMGYVARCSVAEAGAQVRLYYGDSFGELRSSHRDIMDMIQHRILAHSELCLRNPLTATVIVSACCSYACNIGNTVIYLSRWTKGHDAAAHC